MIIMLSGTLEIIFDCVKEMQESSGKDAREIKVRFKETRHRTKAVTLEQLTT